MYVVRKNSILSDQRFASVFLKQKCFNYAIQLNWMTPALFRNTTGTETALLSSQQSAQQKRDRVKEMYVEIRSRDRER